MKALILAGGEGTRLHPLTLRTPKCLLPINKTPNILHIVNSLKQSGINDIYVSISNKQLKINDFLQNEKVNIIIENQDNGKLGSIGGLSYAIKKIDEDDLLVIGADNYFKDFDFGSFSITPGEATLCLFELEDKSLVEHYGIAEVDGGRIKSFQEKPSIHEAKSNYCSTLIYGLSKDWIKNEFPLYLKSNNNMDTIGSMWQFFAGRGKLNAHIHKGVWADIGTVQSYIEINSKEISGQKGEAVIMDGAIIKNSIIEDGCVIGKNVIIENSHIMHDTTIGEGSIIKDSILFENVHVGRHSKINKSVIDGFSIIRGDVVVDDYCIVGYKCVINENSHLLRHSTVWPFLQAQGVIDGNIAPLNQINNLKQSKYWVR